MVMRLTGQEDNCYERASEILDEFGILSLKDQVASLISGGEKRRLEFARTMTLSPSFILLDEPFVGIDPMTVKDIQKMIGKLKNRGIGVIVTDHDVSSIAKVVDRLYVLYKGEVISSGDPEAVLADSQVVEKYLGSDE
jgi:lipopolysaccharide export system ATP-binding protein